jgi:hypothetical protein
MYEWIDLQGKASVLVLVSASLDLFRRARRAGFLLVLPKIGFEIDTVTVSQNSELYSLGRK